jgi:predicted RNA-binding protein with PUA domain
VTYQDVFHVCRTFDIPLVLEVDAELHDKARALFVDLPPSVRFIDPSETLSIVRQILDEPGEASG